MEAERSPGVPWSVRFGFLIMVRGPYPKTDGTDNGSLGEGGSMPDGHANSQRASDNPAGGRDNGTDIGTAEPNGARG